MNNRKESIETSVLLKPDVVLALCRACLSSVFLYSGIEKLLDWSAGVSEMQALGLPIPMILLVCTIIVQIAAGTALLLGTASRAAAFLLAVFTVVATIIAHDFWNASPSTFIRVLTTALEHLAIVGGLLIICLIGAGRFRVVTPFDRLDDYLSVAFDAITDSR
jgi:uncharacterized membrane protein YphA (DoxX/SURF4 family)